jgi:hypothetical protein
MPRPPTSHDLGIERLRAELRAGPTGRELRAAGFVARLGALPLWRRSDLRYAVRVAVEASEEYGPIKLSLSDAGRLLDETTMCVSRGTTRALLFVPEAHADRRLCFRLSQDGNLLLSCELEVPAPGKLSLFIVHHSHLDIGYTDPQEEVLSHHRSYLDSVLDFISATDDWPEDARWRWNVESQWPLRGWLESRPGRISESFFERVHQGRIEVTALPFTLHTEACSMDELARQLHFTDELRARHGLTIESAMQTDVPGATAGLLQALVDADVRYLCVAHNYAGRSVPHLVGGQNLRRPFRWVSPSGKSLLVWYTDSPHGMAYMEGNVLGLSDNYETALELLPEYLAALSSRPYPYEEAAFGWRGPASLAEVTKEPYAHDLLHVRVQGSFGDNAPPSLVPAEIVRRWNAEWAYPRLRLATNREFFAAAEERLGEIDSHEGDWTDWWADGIASAARPLGYNRLAQCSIRTAQTLHALSDAFGGVGRGPERSTRDEVDRVYGDMALFDEHTWGAANPWAAASAGRDSGALQWERKASHARSALEAASALVESGLHHLAASLGASSAPGACVLVFNGSAWSRTDLVRVFVPHSRCSARDLGVLDQTSGEKLAAFVEPQEHAAFRPAGRYLSFIAREVPACGFALYRLLQGDSGSVRAEGDDGPWLENEFLHVEVDVRSGTIARLVDLEVGHDLVSAEAPFGFNGYIYDRYTTAPHFNHLSSRTWVSDRSLLGARTSAAYGVVTARSSTPVWERVTVRLAAEGVHWLETTFTLLRGVKRLDVTNRISKISVPEKESVIFAFPFSIKEPSIDFEITGGITPLDGPRVPGSAEHMRAIRHWISLGGTPTSIAWATLEAPLVQVRNLHLPYAPFPPTLEEESPDTTTIYSCALNNIWDTNFPSEQHGEMVFRYAVASDLHSSGPELGRTAAAALTTPLQALLVGPIDDVPARGSLCGLDRSDVELLTISGSRRGHDLMLLLQSHAPVPVQASVSLPLLRVRRSWKGSYLERGLSEIANDGHSVNVGLDAGELCSLSLDLEGATSGA